MDDVRELRTRLALKGVDLAESFNTTLGRLRLLPHGYRPELVAPEEQSTGGGIKAAQRLLLLPTVTTATPIVVGMVNLVEQTAELRTYTQIDALHRERFGVDVPLDEGEYVKFLERARRYLLALEVTATFAAHARDTVVVAPPRPKWPWIVAAVVAALLGVGLLVFLRR